VAKDNHGIMLVTEPPPNAKVPTSTLNASEVFDYLDNIIGSEVHPRREVVYSLATHFKWPQSRASFILDRMIESEYLAEVPPGEF